MFTLRTKRQKETCFQYQLSFKTSFRIDPVFLAGTKSGNVGKLMLDKRSVDCVDDVECCLLWPGLVNGWKKENKFGMFINFPIKFFSYLIFTIYYEKKKKGKNRLTVLEIGRAGNWFFGADSLSKNLTKAADNEASASWKEKLLFDLKIEIYKKESKFLIQLHLIWNFIWKKFTLLGTFPPLCKILENQLFFAAELLRPVFSLSESLKSKTVENTLITEVLSLADDVK